jgi:hypothetical protein
MAQVLPTDFPIDPTTTSGTDLADRMNRFFQSQNSGNSGAVQPNPVFPGMFWLDTSDPAFPDGRLRMRNAANNAWIDAAGLAGGLVPGDNLADLADASAARGNLGLGTNGAQGYRNRVVNAGLRVMQRGPGPHGVSSALGGIAYGFDGFFASLATSVAVWTQARVFTGLTAPNSPYYGLRVQKQFGQGGNSSCTLGQIILAGDMRDLWGGPVTLSFWARCGANYSAAGNALNASILQATAEDQSSQYMMGGSWTGPGIPATQAFTLTTAYQRFKLTMPTFTNGMNSFGFDFTANSVGTAGANDWFEVAGFQVEGGDMVTPWELKPLQADVDDCESRFLGLISTAPAHALTGGGYFDSANVAVGIINLRRKLRAVPTAVAAFDAGGGASAGGITIYSTGASRVATGIVLSSAVSSDVVPLVFNFASAAVPGDGCFAAFNQMGARLMVLGAEP